MTITQLQVFLAVADRSSFMAAAESLVMSQSAVSHALASLERELGAPLLERGPGRPVALTELGLRVAADARELVRRSERIAEQSSSYLGLEAGKLRVASVVSVASRVLPSLLGRFRTRHPRVEVVVHEGADPEVHDWLVGGVADVGFLAIPLDGLEVVGTVTEDPFMAVLPAGHSLAVRSAIRPDELSREPFVISRSGCEPLITAWFGSCPPRIEYEVRSVDTMVGFVREGLGVTILPELVHPEDTTGLAIRPLDPPATRRVVLARAAGIEPTPAIGAFLREVMPAAAPEPPTPPAV
jgi:DNA-binding transcriptional LysR family regulator